MVSERKRITSYLVWRLDDEPEQAIVWDTLDISAGRRKTMDLVISDPEVSREHAVFRRDGERASVEDLNTAIGTLVNGERITRRELRPGDVVTIGRMQLRFGRTEKSVRPGANVRFASELKGGLAMPAKADSGRTMLAFDAEDELAMSQPTVPPSSERIARAVSADGSLEEIDDDPLGLSLDASLVPGSAAVRDLDGELGRPAPLEVLDAPAPPLEADPKTQSRLRRTLVLEVDGPGADVEALLAAVDGRQIRVGEVAIRVKKLDFD